MSSIPIFLSLVVSTPASATPCLEQSGLTACRPPPLTPSVIRTPQDEVNLTNTPVEMASKVRRVDLNQCTIASANADITWQARNLFGRSASDWFDMEPFAPVRTLDACTRSWQVPFEGNWEFRARDGETILGSTDEIEVRDFWMGSIGDSYSSGEGAADTYNFGEGLEFLHQECHRSTFGWPYLLATALQQEKRDVEGATGTQFLFSYLACSGAALDRGIIDAGNFEGPEKLGPIPGQVETLESLKGETFERPGSRYTAASLQTDLLVLTAGGNDAMFGDIVRECVGFNGDCEDRLEETELAAAEVLRDDWRTWSGAPSPHRAADVLDFIPITEAECRVIEKGGNRFHKVHCRYQRLKRRLEEGGVLAPTHPEAPSNVLALEIPDISRNDNGEFAGWCDGTVFLTDAEIERAHDGFLIPLNAIIEKTVTEQNHWTFVSGPYTEFREHGVCAGDNWINTRDDSLDTQNNVSGWDDDLGTMHPNAVGNRVMKDEIFHEARAVMRSLETDRRLPVIEVQATREDETTREQIDLAGGAISGPFRVDLQAPAGVVIDGASLAGGAVSLNGGEWFVTPGGAGSQVLKVHRSWDPQQTGNPVPLPDQEIPFVSVEPLDLLVIKVYDANNRLVTFNVDGDHFVQGGIWLEPVRWEAHHPSYQVSIQIEAPGTGPTDYTGELVTAAAGIEHRILDVNVFDGTSVRDINVAFSVAAGSRGFYEEVLPKIEVQDDTAGTGATFEYGPYEFFGGTIYGFLEQPGAPEGWNQVRFVPRAHLYVDRPNPACTNPSESCDALPFTDLDLAYAVTRDLVRVGDETSVLSISTDTNVGLNVCINALADCAAGHVSDPRGALSFSLSVGPEPDPWDGWSWPW